MQRNFLKQLNSQQQKAVLATEGPSLILAGAGSGKTRVLTSKVAYLILEKNISPDKILMVTFTNKAALEMKRRIFNLLRVEKQTSIISLPFVGTFHALCVRILRREAKNIGLSPYFLIYDKDDTKTSVKEAMKRLGIDKKDIHPQAAAATISQAKNELVNQLEYATLAQGHWQEYAAKIYIEYQKILTENSALDFDDLIFEVVRLFRKFPNITANWQNKFQYVLVDEYQDTNHAQYILTKQLTKSWRNISVVGDASQSIYHFRGADFRNMLNFKKDFGETNIFHLEQNYRSTQTILDASYCIISKNRSHPILKLWTEKNGGQPIIIYQARNEQEEAFFLIKKLTELQYQDPTLNLSEIAVLYRTNAQSRVIEEALLHVGIAYILVGGVRFYERREIKDLLSYLRYFVNRNDKISLSRIHKLGKKRLQKYLDFLDKSDKNKQTFSTIDLLDTVVATTDFLSLFSDDNEEDRARRENIKELRSVAYETSDIVEFLTNVALVEREYIPDKPSFVSEKKQALTLMTMHAAKGLEFKAVFIIGMEEGLFPHAQSLLDEAELEEERRLCYVGMTRAKEYLFLTFASNRLYFGIRNSNTVSRFVTELPPQLTTLTTDYSA